MAFAPSPPHSPWSWLQITFNANIESVDFVKLQSVGNVDVRSHAG
jgi:hypothetical protein